MQHNYTDEEIQTAWKDALSSREFLAALPERPQAQPSPWPGQQEAIDAAFQQIDEFYLDYKSSHDDWEHEAPARLAIAKAYDAARPQAAEIAKLKDALAESEKQFQDKVYEIARLLDERDKAQGILKACLSVMPFGNLETHTFENLPGRIADLASEIASLSLENERLEAELAALRQSTQLAQPILADDGRSLGKVAKDAYNSSALESEMQWWDAAAQAVAAVVLAQAVRRMEAVPQAEAKDEPATFEALGKTWTRHTPGDPMPCDGDVMVHALLSDDMADDPPVQAKNMQWDYAGAGDVIGWRYADEPAQAQQEPAQPWTPENAKAYEDFQAELRETWEAQPWTPAVGDVVRLKSGGDAYTVIRYMAEKDEWACVASPNSGVSYMCVPAACLTPSRP